MFVTNIPGLDLKLSIVVHIGCGRCLLENLMSFLGQATPRPIGKKTILPVENTEIYIERKKKFM